jgi:hypothetical protein
MLSLNNYSLSFGILAVPFIAVIFLLFYLYNSTKDVVDSRVKDSLKTAGRVKLTRAFWLCTLA